MSKRIVCGVLCGLLAMAIGCGVKKPTPPDSCSSVPYRVLVKDGVRYLHVPLPDGNIVIINIDTLPPPPPAPPPPPPGAAADSAAGAGSAAGSAGTGNFVEPLCPCEDPGCIPMCNRLLRLTGQGANLCTK
jgi:hypothetical protein